MLKVGLLSLLLVLSALTWADSGDDEYIFVVRKGDTLSAYFATLDIPQLTLVKLLGAYPPNAQLNRLKPKQIMSIRLDKNANFKQIYYEISAQKTMVISYRDGHFVTHYQKHRAKKPLKNNWQKETIIIKNSFFTDGTKANIARTLLKKVLQVFSGVINFDKELFKGDKFIVISQNKKLLSAHYTGRHRQLDAYLYQGDYYDKDGFLIGDLFSPPLKRYKRISSEFSKYRFHPIFKEYRKHNGLDYAARVGTPIYAARDGVVRFSRTMGGYGKVVYIKHDKKYTTIYAHMSKIYPKIKEGKTVKRRDIIGYVGQTGWANGPHLHFETRVFNKAQDPRKFIAESLAQTNKVAFKKLRQQIGKIDYFIRYPLDHYTKTVAVAK